MTLGKLSDSQIISAHSEYIKGANTIDLALKYGINRTSFYGHFHRLGLHVNRSGNGSAPRPEMRKLTDDIIRAAHVEYTAGSSSTELASKYGLNHLSFRRHFRRLDLPVRSHSEARKNMWLAITPQKKQTYMKAAHDTVRGKTQNFEHLCKRATYREMHPLAFTKQER